MTKYIFLLFYTIAFIPTPLASSEYKEFYHTAYNSINFRETIDTKEVIGSSISCMTAGALRSAIEIYQNEPYDEKSIVYDRNRVLDLCHRYLQKFYEGLVIKQGKQSDPRQIRRVEEEASFFINQEINIIFQKIEECFRNNTACYLDHNQK